MLPYEPKASAICFQYNFLAYREEKLQGLRDIGSMIVHVFFSKVCSSEFTTTY